MLDCHCHLLDISKFSSEFFLNSIKECSVHKIYCNSTDRRQWPQLKALSEKYEQVIPFFGCHPWHLTSSSFDSLEFLSELLNSPFAHCGEIGLDRLCNIDFSLQKEIFIKQLEIAKKTKSFVAIHCVKAWGPLLEILSDYQKSLSFMVHSFTGSLEVMRRLINMGGMISFSDRILQNKQAKFLEILEEIPLKNILLETDFPFQTSLPGTSPSIYCQLMSNLYTFVAKIKNISITELTEIIRNNGSICTY